MKTPTDLPSAELLDDLEEDLVARAFLFEHPATYREAVEIAFEAVRAAVARRQAVA